jgi:hypothetical protein
MELASKTLANGTSYKGTINTTYNKLVEAFGLPNSGPSGDGKVKIEWVLKNKKKQIITIYDWKTNQSPLPDEYYDWQIGSHQGGAVEQVLEAIINRELPPNL